MIAGGVGITPLYSMLSNLQATDGYDVLMFNGCKNDQEIIFKDGLADLAEQPHIKIIDVFSEQAGKPQLIDAERLKTVPDLASREVFICGPVPMMNNVTADLLELGVPKKNIHSERFDY